MRKITFLSRLRNNFSTPVVESWNVSRPLIDKSEKLTKNFKWYEVIDSTTAENHGIDNTIPTEKVATALKELFFTVMEPVRSLYKKPIQITSGYRCKALNTLVGGSKNSQHMLGEAADFVQFGVNSYDLWKLVALSNIPFDQIIYYDFGTWIHISHKLEGNQRRLITRASKDTNGKVTYKHYTQEMIKLL